MRRVVTAENTAPMVHREDAVGGARHLDAVLRLEGDAAGQQQVARANNPPHPLAKLLGLTSVIGVGALVLKGIGDRRLGPQQQPRLLAGLAGQAPQPRKIAFLEALPPLVLLADIGLDDPNRRSEEHTSELQSLMRISYAVFC